MRKMFTPRIEAVGAAIDLAGVFFIAAGLLLATVHYLVRLFSPVDDNYSRFRQDIGRVL